MKSKTNKSGFTLIELLIVIAIIVILAGTVFFAVNPAKRYQESRDARRFDDIRNLQHAIDLYIVDNGHAPYLQGTCGPENPNPDCFTNETAGSPRAWSLFEQDLVNYMKKVPKDPCGVDCYGGDYTSIFAYNYYAPGDFMYQCNDAGNSGCGDYTGNLTADEAKSMYSIYAENFEVDGNEAWGFGNNPFGSF